MTFSKNVYTDEIYQYVFNEDIDVTDLVDNLNRPLSQIYLTIVKTDSNNIFSDIKSGIEAPEIERLNDSNTLTYLNNIPIIQKIHNGTTSVPFTTANPLEVITKVTQPQLTYYYGDVVQYNKFEVKEVVLSDVYHRFNTNNRDSTPPTALNIGGPRLEGYYYKPHHEIEIRRFSDYVEQGDDSVFGMPEYKVDLGDGRYLWRDLLDIGFNETEDTALNYPFLNGCHYIYDTNCFEVKRQDPFRFWGLLYLDINNISDIFGNTIGNNFIVNEVDNVC